MIAQVILISIFIEYDPENETDFGDAIIIPEQDIDYSALELTNKGYFPLFFSPTLSSLPSILSCLYYNIKPQHHNNQIHEYHVALILC